MKVHNLGVQICHSTVFHALGTTEPECTEIPQTDGEIVLYPDSITRTNFIIYRIKSLIGRAVALLFKSNEVKSKSTLYKRNEV